MNLPDKIQHVQASFGLKAKQLAVELRITPEWLSKIMADPSRASDDISLRLDEFIRRRGLEPSSFYLASADSPIVAEGPSEYVPPDALREELRRRFEETLAAAGDDPARLGWMSVQLDMHLAPPAQWLKNKIIRAVLPSQKQAISTHTGKPIQRGAPGAQEAS